MKKMFLLAGFYLMLTGTVQAAPLPVNHYDAAVQQQGEPEPHPNTIYLKIKWNGNTLLLPLLTFPYDTIGNVRSQAEGILGVPLDNLIMRYNNQVLNDALTLAYYGIGAGAIISTSWQ